jgi:hypothetical protein
MAKQKFGMNLIRKHKHKSQAPEQINLQNKQNI